MIILIKHSNARVLKKSSANALLFFLYSLFFILYSLKRKAPYLLPSRMTASSPRCTAMSQKPHS